MLATYSRQSPDPCRAKVADTIVTNGNRVKHHVRENTAIPAAYSPIGPPPISAPLMHNGRLTLTGRRGYTHRVHPDSRHAYRSWSCSPPNALAATEVVFEFDCEQKSLLGERSSRSSTARIHRTLSRMQQSDSSCVRRVRA